MSRRARERREAMDAKYLAMVPMDDADPDHDADADGHDLGDENTDILERSEWPQ